ASIPVEELISGTLTTVTIDVTWTGVGPVIHEGGTPLRCHTDTFVVHMFFQGTRRAAHATGSVVLGGVNLAPAVSQAAELDHLTQGQIVVLKDPTAEWEC